MRRSSACSIADRTAPASGHRVTGRALLALGVPAAWDLEGATGGIGRSHEKTDFAGISTVPPGCYAIAKDGDVRIYPYWDWEIPTAEQMRKDTRSEAE